MYIDPPADFACKITIKYLQCYNIQGHLVLDLAHQYMKLPFGVNIYSLAFILLR